MFNKLISFFKCLTQYFFPFSLIDKYNDETIIFQRKFNEFCDKNNINKQLDHSIIRNDATELKIDGFIRNYIYNTLTQEQVNAILCKYGLTKAIALFHDFHVIGMNCSAIHVCEYLADPDLKSDYYMVELIFLDVVGFHSNWRNNKKVKFKSNT